MTKKLEELLKQAETWPEEAQQELAELALEIEAEMADGPYHASADELNAIDKALTGELASDEEVRAAFAKFRRE